MRPPIDWLGPTPWEDIAAAYDEQCPEGFSLVLPHGSEDVEIATLAINQGIDSRLEAVSFVEPPDWNVEEVGEFKLAKIHMKLDKRGLLVFLRRLYEYEYGEAVDKHDEAKADMAHSLRSGILSSLGIEEI